MAALVRRTMFQPGNLCLAMSYARLATRAAYTGFRRMRYDRREQTSGFFDARSAGAFGKLADAALRP
jgi:hypothetical protein